MNEIIELITAKEKAIRVINSCETKVQINGAKNYVELFNNRYNDYLSYEDLKRKLLLKINQINE